MNPRSMFSNPRGTDRFQTIRFDGNLLVFSLFFVIIAPRLLSYGMFRDGLTYAAISQNLSESAGSYWDLNFSAHWLNHFRSHPPLSFWLESFCFDLFGNHLWVEKLYSVATILLSAFLTAKLWTSVGGKRHLSWLPLLLLLLVPSVTWTATNNILENTMMVFVLASAVCIVLAQSSRRWLWLFLAGLSLFAAFLSKGLTGLYPLCLPFLLWIVRRDKKPGAMFLDTVFLLAVFGCCFALLFLTCSEAWPFFSYYLYNTVGGGITAEKVVNNRFFVLKFFLQDTAIVIALFLLLTLPQTIKRKKAGTLRRPALQICQYPLILLLLTLAGILPMMVTLKQRSFYLITVYPFFCIAVGLLLQSAASSWIARMGNKARHAVSTATTLCLCSAIILTFTFNGKIIRDRDMIRDTIAVLSILHPGQTVSIPPDMNYGHIAYLGRLGKIDCDMCGTLHPFLIATDESLCKQPGLRNAYRKVGIPTKQYHLYARKKPQQ